MMYTNGLMNSTKRITNRATATETKNLSGLPTYGLWSPECILYHLIFGSPLCNFESQQINILLSDFIYHFFHLYAMFVLLLLDFLELMLIVLAIEG